jgi:hypothetical protein
MPACKIWTGWLTDICLKHLPGLPVLPCWQRMDNLWLFWQRESWYNFCVGSWISKLMKNPHHCLSSPFLCRNFKLDQLCQWLQNTNEWRQYLSNDFIILMVEAGLGTIWLLASIYLALSAKSSFCFSAPCDWLAFAIPNAGRSSHTKGDTEGDDQDLLKVPLHSKMHLEPLLMGFRWILLGHQKSSLKWQAWYLWWTNIWIRGW